MPIYEYKCPNCGLQKDMLRKVSDPAPECPECEQAVMVKQVTAAAFRLKGTGWYETDFKNKNTAPAKGDGQSGSGSQGQDKSGSSKGESKAKSSSNQA